jgi:hypothetical protein
VNAGDDDDVLRFLNNNFFHDGDGTQARLAPGRLAVPQSEARHPLPKTPRSRATRGSAALEARNAPLRRYQKTTEGPNHLENSAKQAEKPPE